MQFFVAAVEVSQFAFAAFRQTQGFAYEMFISPFQGFRSRRGNRFNDTPSACR
jgi:hypothetical protein